MKNINKLSDIKCGEYFVTLDLMNKMNSKEITAKEGITKIINAFDSKVDVDKMSASKAEKFLSSVLEVINDKDRESNFNHIIEIDKVVYGFEPSFESMEAGAFQDLQDYLIADKYMEALTILYRPITRNYMEKRYDISSYVDESNNSFAYRAHMLSEHLNAQDAIGVLDFFVVSLLK